MDTQPRPVGRPTKYLPEYCERVIELGKQGYSKAEVAASFDVTRKTLDNWCAEYPDFLHAMTRAKELSLGWWEGQGRLGIWSKHFNANAYRLQVMNRFSDDWRDKQETQHSGDVHISVDTGITRRKPDGAV